MGHEHVNALLRTQAGAVHHRQARELGMSERQIAGRLTSGAWQAAHPCVYVVAGTPPSLVTRCAAASLAVRYATRLGEQRRVALAGAAAAVLHGFDVPEPALVDVVVPFADSAVELAGVRVMRARTWPQRLFTRTDGIVVTGVADTVVDIAWSMGRDRLHAVLQQEAFARPRLTHEVIAACRRGRTGSAAARRAAALVLAGVDSALHRRGHALAEAAGLPRAECGVVVVEGAGPSDCLFRVPGAAAPPYGLVVEWDGDAHRVDRQTFLHDREKDRLLRRAGYVTVRYTDAQVRQVAPVVDDLRAEWAAVLERSVQGFRRSRAS